MIAAQGDKLQTRALREHTGSHQRAQLAHDPPELEVDGLATVLLLPICARSACWMTSSATVARSRIA